jgi:ABC-2 type transport system ATP-binding protein
MKEVVKRYKEVVALNRFNFEINEGEIVGLLGPNGSGKSTAINCLLGLLSYDEGEVEVFGRRVSPDDMDTNSGSVLFRRIFPFSPNCR